VAISVVQTAAWVNSAWTGTFGVNVTAGNTVFLAASGYNTTSVTISSSAPTFGGGSVSGAAKILEQAYPYDGAATDYGAVWMLPNVAGGSASFGLTMTNSQAITAVGIMAWEVSGLGTGPVTDQSVSADGASTAVSSGATGAIASAPEFVIGFGVQDATVTTIPGAPWASTSVNPGTNNNSFTGYQIATSSGGTYTYSATATVTAKWAAGTVTVATTPAVAYSMRMMP